MAGWATPRGGVAGWGTPLGVLGLLGVFEGVNRVGVTGVKGSTLKVGIIVVVAIIDIAVGPGGGFGGPGFCLNSGLPLLLFLPKPPPGQPKPPPGPTAMDNCDYHIYSDF